MPTDPKGPADDLRRRVEAHLLSLNCGLRHNGQVFEVYDLEDARIVVTFSDLEHFAAINGLSVE